MNFKIRFEGACIKITRDKNLFNSVVYLKQVHSEKIYFLDENVEIEDIKSREGDGIVTVCKGIYVGVRTADCLAVAFINKERVGVLHVGWRGLKKGIIENMGKFFPDKLNTFIFLSPSAGKCCYEVGEEFRDYFPSNIYLKSNKLIFDLRGEAMERLRRLGFVKFINYDVCTICNEKFPSYRRNRTEDRIYTLAKLL